MRLIDRLARGGKFLSWLRSYLPLTIPPAVLLAMFQAADFEGQWGDALHDGWIYACMAISFLGLAVRWAVVGFDRAGTCGSHARLHETAVLHSTGFYSVVRNPLHFANFIVMLGMALSTTAWWFVLLATVTYCICVECVIDAEEQVLAKKFGPDYDAWARNTPKFLPRLTRWRPPEERFSFRAVLRREYGGPLFVSASFFAFESFADVMLGGEELATWLKDDYVWVVLLAATLAVCVVLWTLKSRTRLLSAPWC